MDQGYGDDPHEFQASFDAELPRLASHQACQRGCADQTGHDEDRSEHEPHGFASEPPPRWLRASPATTTIAPALTPRWRQDNSRRPHFVNGLDAVPGLDLDASDGVLDHDDVQTRAPRVQGRPFHAIVSGQAADKGAANAARGEESGQIGPLKAGIRLGVSGEGLGDDVPDARLVQGVMEGGAVRPATQCGRPDAALGRERAVVGGVPVAGSNGQPIGQGEER